MPSSCAVRHHLDPGRGRQLALGEHPAHVVVEDLGGGARDRVQPGLAQLGQQVPNGHAGLGRAGDDLHRRERVHVHARHPLLHRPDQVGVGGGGQRRVDAALHADLGGAVRPGLLGPVGDLVQREPVRVGVALALGERAEPAADVADVGEVDVAVDHVGDVVADRVAAQVVGEPHQRRPAPGRPPRTAPSPALLRGAAARPGRRRPGAARPRTSPSIRDGAHRDWRWSGVRGHLGPVAVDGVEVAAAVAGPAGRVDGGVQVGAADRRRLASGSCHGRPDRPRRLDRQAGRRVGQRQHVRRQPRVEPRARRRARPHVLGIDRQPLPQREPGLGRQAGQRARSAATGAPG